MSVASEFDIQRQLITNAYNKLDDLGIDSTGVDKNIDNIAEMLDTVYEEYPKITGQGTEVTLDGTKVGKLSLDVKGNSTQETTTGKNKLNNTLASVTVSGVTFTVNEDKTIKINGTATSTITRKVGELSLPTGNYILSGCPTGGSGSSYLLRTQDGVNISSVFDTGSGASFSITETTGTANVNIQILSGTVCNNLVFKPMVRLSSVSDATYEKFTYGASPNPNYEQPIYSAGDDIQLFDKTLTAFTNVNTSSAILDTGIRAISTQTSSSTGTNNNIRYIACDIQNLIGQTITLSAHAKSSSTNKGLMYLRLCKQNGDATSTYGTQLSSETLDGDLQITYTIPNGIGDYHYLMIALYSVRNSSVVANDYVDYTNLKLQKGSIATQYTSYGMGSISEKIVNKNLYDIEQYPLTLNRALDTTTGNFYQTSSGNYYGVLSYIPFSQFVSKTLAINTTLIVAFYDKDKNYIGYIKPLTSDKTVPNGTAFIRLECGKDYINEIQIEIGSTATNFVAHQEQTYTIPTQQPMRSIGDVRDEFIKVNGEWKERHNIKNVVLNGTENWAIALTGTSNWYYYCTISSISILSNSTATNTICTHYPYGAVGNSNTNQGIYIVKDTKMVRIRWGTEDTIENFKTWLASNNVTINYISETPVDLPCTAEQIAILENMPKSYNEQTNIYSLDVTPAYVEAKALKGE